MRFRCWQLRELRDSLTASTISLVCVWACVSLAVLRVGVSLLAVQRCILEGVVYCLYVIYMSVCSGGAERVQQIEACVG